MLSAAASGSVSDATKTAPTFSIDNILINFEDDMGLPLPGAPYTLTNGLTAPVPAASYALIGNIRLLRLRVTPSQSASSKRATDHPGFIGWYDFINGTSTMTFLEHETHFEHVGDYSGHLGNFGEASEDGPFSFSLPNGGVGHGLDHGTQLEISLDESPIEKDNPELDAGLLPSVRAVFTIRQDSLTIFNSSTGVYSHGPSDDFTFTIDLQP